MFRKNNSARILVEGYDKQTPNHNSNIYIDHLEFADINRFLEYLENKVTSLEVKESLWVSKVLNYVDNLIDKGIIKTSQDLLNCLKIYPVVGRRQNHQELIRILDIRENYLDKATEISHKARLEMLNFINKLLAEANLELGIMNLTSFKRLQVLELKSSENVRVKWKKLILRQCYSNNHNSSPQKKWTHFCEINLEVMQFLFSEQS